MFGMSSRLNSELLARWPKATVGFHEWEPWCRPDTRLAGAVVYIDCWRRSADRTDHRYLDYRESQKRHTEPLSGRGWDRPRPGSPSHIHRHADTASHVRSR